MGIIHPFIDTHVHIDRCDAPERELVAARVQGSELFVVPGVTSAAWDGLRMLAERHSDVRIAPGLHPQASREWDATITEKLEKLLKMKHSAAVGEIGLDSFVDVPSDVQEEAFRGQLRLAVKHDLPVLIHCRRRIGRIVEILTEEGADRVGGIFHAFSGSIESARQVIDLGFAVGIGGPLTWPNARRLVNVVQELPEESIALETDAPDLTPHPHQGTPNRPEYLPLIATRLAEVRGWSLDETARITTNNARRVLRLNL